MVYRCIALMTAALSCAGVPALAEAPADAMRDLTVEQSSVYAAAAPRPGRLQVAARVDRPDGVYAARERLRLFVRVNEEAYVTVLSIGPAGRVTQLFPNAYQRDNRVGPSAEVEVPAEQSGVAIAVAPPFGVELIKVIASSRPINLFAPGQLRRQGMFAVSQGGAGALVRSLELAAQAQGDNEVAVDNLLVRTVARRSPASAPVAAAPPAGQQLALPRLRDGFPILLALDRPSYRVGDRLAMTVTATQACHLTVLNVNSRGQIRILFPNQRVQSKLIAANETVWISGGNAPVAIAAAEPAGVEQVVAVCTTEPDALFRDGLDFRDVFPTAPPRAIVERDLAVVAAAPPGQVGLAATTITIER